MYDVSSAVRDPMDQRSEPSHRLLVRNLQDFFSYWWGEPVIQFIQYLDQAVVDFRVNCDGDQESRGGGMIAGTPV